MDYQLYHDDCLLAMRTIADGSVDLILCDLPYGTTACAWDTVIDLSELWKQYRRIIKKNGAIVLTAAQPFTTTLIHSNFEWFKYEWIWVKNRATNFAHAKNKPMKKHENVLVFSEGTTVHASQSPNRMPYNPQGLTTIAPVTKVRRPTQLSDAFFTGRPSHASYTRDTTGYPNSILEFPTDQLGLHPTAKPVALMEYLIRTYTTEGETVMDNTMGSGTTGVAAMNTGRNFIGMEMEEKYFIIAKQRIEDAKNNPIKFQ